MNGRTGIPLVLLAGGLVVLGIGLGAANQKETFIGNQVGDDPSVGSDVTILTAFIVGCGVLVFCLAIGQSPMRRRLPAAIIAAISAWLLGFVVQAAWPNYVVIPEHGVASILHSNLVLESAGSPSVLLPVFTLGILLMAGIGWAIQRVEPTAEGLGGSAATLRDIRRDHLAVVALDLPILLVTGAGMIRVMLEFPSESSGLGLMTFLNPLAAVGCITLALSVTLRAHHVARLSQGQTTTSEFQEAWATFGRIDMAAIISLALVAILSTFLVKEPAEITSSGPTLVFTLRSHGQAVLFLAAILVPLHLLHQRIGAVVTTATAGNVERGTTIPLTVFWTFIGVVGVGLLLAILTTFLSSRALAPWIVALVPAAIVGGIVGRPASSALVRVIAAWALWGKGNTISAVYDAGSFPDLEFAVHPGLSALWRMAAAAMIGWVVFDVLKEAGSDDRPKVVVPLSLAAAFGVALLGLLELPLNVWAEAIRPVDKVAVGSLLRSQQSGVQVIMHVMAAVCGIGAAASTARILRPDWFPRRGRDPLAERRAAHTTA